MISRNDSLQRGGHADCGMHKLVSPVQFEVNEVGGSGARMERERTFIIFTKRLIFWIASWLLH